MTPVQKAIDLIEQFNVYAHKTVDKEINGLQIESIDNGKQCALIAVDEVLDEFMFDDSEYAKIRYDYWEKVRQAIKNL